jgi:bis(5'-nucleosidyl)-tetraphosphatase
MQTKTDQSFGVVPVIKNEAGEWEVFLINQINRSGGVFWGFPKGHAENDENGQDAALRELAEETNIAINQLDINRPFIQKYAFTDNDILVEKTVTYFLGYVKSKDFTVQATEVAEACWCDFSTARKLLSHENNRVLLDEVQEYLLN